MMRHDKHRFAEIKAQCVVHMISYEGIKRTNLIQQQHKNKMWEQIWINIYKNIRKIVYLVRIFNGIGI